MKTRLELSVIGRKKSNVEAALEFFEHSFKTSLNGDEQDWLKSEFVFKTETGEWKGKVIFENAAYRS